MTKHSHGLAATNSYYNSLVILATQPFMQWQSTVMDWLTFDSNLSYNNHVPDICICIKSLKWLIWKLTSTLSLPALYLLPCFHTDIFVSPLYPATPYPCGDWITPWVSLSHWPAPCWLVSSPLAEPWLLGLARLPRCCPLVSPTHHSLPHPHQHYLLRMNHNCL